MKDIWKCSYCGIEESCTFTMPENNALEPKCCPFVGKAGWVRVESEDDDVEE